MLPIRQKYNRGFSMISVMATTAFASLTMLMLSQMIRSARNGTMNIENNVQFDVLKSSLGQLFRNSGLCAASFQNPDGSGFQLPPGPGPITGTLEIRVGGQRLAFPGKGIGSGATISRLEFQRVDGPTPLPSGRFQSSVLLYLSMEMNPRTSEGRTLSNDQNPFLLNLETDATGRILLCDAEGAPASPPDPSPSPTPSPSPGSRYDLVGCTTHTLSNGSYQCPVGDRAAFVSCSFRETLGRDSAYPRVSGRWAYCDGSNDVNSGIVLCCTAP